MNMKSYIPKIIHTVSLPVLKEPLFFTFMYILGTLSITVEPDYPPFYLKLYTDLFLDTYILTTLVVIIPKRARTIVKITVCIFLYLLTCVDFFCLNRLGTNITPTIVGLIFETNKNEATDFLNSYINTDIFQSNIIVVICLAVLHLFAFAYTKDKSIVSDKIGWPVRFLILLSLIVSIIVTIPNKKRLFVIFSQESTESTELLFANDYWNGKILYQPTYRLFFALQQIWLANKQIQELKQNSQNISSLITGLDHSPENIVLIIGESYNKHHSQLYGYPLPTTPKQMERQQYGELFVFTDAISPSNLTSEVFKDVLSMNDVSHNEPWYEKPLFTQYFKSSGYNVVFITNQYVPSVQNSVFDFSGGAILNDKEISQSQFTHRNTKSHDLDEDLIIDYDSLRRYSTKNNLFIFHLIGQHVAYKQRFPNHFSHFGLNDYHRPQLTTDEIEIVKDYDNATYYNDYVTNQIISQFEKEDAIVIYLSDHGEECFDEINTFGRLHGEINSFIAKNEFEIPLWIWCSSNYITRHEQIVDNIKTSLSKPITSDDLGHLLLYLGGIKCRDYKDTKNPILPQYDTRQKRLIKKYFDYDSIIHSKHE